MRTIAVTLSLSLTSAFSWADEVEVPTEPTPPPGGGTYVDYGAPAGSRTGAGATQDVNSHLPSSSKPSLDGSGDGFDLRQRSSGGGIILGGGTEQNAYDTYGSEGSMALDGSVKTVSRKPVPEFHMVKKGDTLWDLSGTYYDNPRQWPRLWSMNPQLENPHWIYPGDQLRTGAPRGEATDLPKDDNSAGPGGFIGRERSVPQGTVFLRDQGYIGDPDRDVWGEVVGAKEEVMMLAKGDTVYLLIEDEYEPRVGQRLSIFEEVRTPTNVPGSRKPPGELVKVYGTVRVDAFDRDTRVAKGVLIESLDVVERGSNVGPVGRRFDVVPPKASSVDVEARILTSVYPNVLFGQHQVVFLDKGSEDGLAPGNRLRAVRRGDTWRRQLKTTSRHARMRVPLDDGRDAPAEITPLRGDDETFPDEVVGEVRILRCEDYSSIAMVTESARALEAGEKLIAVQGY